MNKTYLFWLSMVANIVLVVALFFKSALNHIVIDWVQSKRTKRDLLIDLYNQVSSFANTFGNICSYEYLFSLSPFLRTISQPVWQDNFQEFSDASKFISDNRLRFSEDLQRMIDHCLMKARLMML